MASHLVSALCADDGTECGQDPDCDQRTWHAQIQPVYRNHCQGDENEVQVVGKRLFAEAHHRGQDQANCRRRHAWQRRGDKSVIPVAVIDDADREHQHSAWKADADDCGDGAHHATQLFSDYDRHVGRIQTGKALADRQLHEFLVVNPM